MLMTGSEYGKEENNRLMPEYWCLPADLPLAGEGGRDVRDMHFPDRLQRNIQMKMSVKEGDTLCAH